MCRTSQFLGCHGRAVTRSGRYEYQDMLRRRRNTDTVFPLHEAANEEPRVVKYRVKVLTTTVRSVFHYMRNEQATGGNSSLKDEMSSTTSRLEKGCRI
jgi:hypothetical protein